MTTTVLSIFVVLIGFFSTAHSEVRVPSSSTNVQILEILDTLVPYMGRSIEEMRLETSTDTFVYRPEIKTALERLNSLILSGQMSYKSDWFQTMGQQLLEHPHKLEMATSEQAILLLAAIVHHDRQVPGLFAQALHKNTIGRIGNKL